MPAKIVTTSRKRRATSATPSFPWPVLACAIVLLGTLFAMRVLRKSGPAEPPPPAPTPVQTIESPTSIVPPPAATNLQVSTFDSPTSSPPAKAAVTNTFVKRPGALQLPGGKVLTFPPPAPGEFRIVHSHGKMYKCDSEGNWEDVTPKPIFDNSFEECLVGLSVEGGGFIPGMLMGLDEAAVRKMLEKPVVINEDDGEDVVAKKEAVAQMKAVILDYMDGGGKFDDFVMEMYQFSAQERTLKGKGLKRLFELVREGKVDAARAYRDTYNEVLAKQGFSALKLPKRLSEALGEE